MEIIRIRQRLEELPEEIFKAEIDYVTAKATMEHMNDMKRHLLATLKNNLPKASNAAQETFALAHIDYKRHLEGIHSTTLESGMKGAYYHKLKNELDAMRSLNKNID